MDLLIPYVSEKTNSIFDYLRDDTILLLNDYSVISNHFKNRIT